MHVNNGNASNNLKLVYEKHLKGFAEYLHRKFGKGGGAGNGRGRKAGDWLCDVAKAVKNREDYEATKGGSKANSRRTSLSGYDEDVVDLLVDMKSDKDGKHQDEAEGRSKKRAKKDQGPSSSMV